MENLIKPIGIIHIEGINDEEYAKYIASLEPSKDQIMISIVNNRW